jgi:predicted nucleic acid-binding protein
MGEMVALRPNEKKDRLGKRSFCTDDGHDLIITAAVRVAGYGVITANSREFEYVPGLTVVTPQA